MGIAELLAGQGASNGLFTPISPQPGDLAQPSQPFTPMGPVSAAAKQSIQGIDSATGAAVVKTVSIAKVRPGKAQPTDNLETPDSLGFPDFYRNGDPSGSSSETFHPRTLAGQSRVGEEEMLASISLKQPQKNGKSVTFVDNYSRFFLQSVVEAEQEKYQVVETFTGFYTFFYGKRPPIYRYSGVLLSDPNYRWNNDFKFMYDNFLRGTMAVELLAEVVITYDGRVITGFPLSLTMQQDAINDKGMPFTIDVLVVDHTKMQFSLDVEDLLATVANNIQETKDNLGRMQRLLGSASGKSIVSSDNATNQKIPAFSVRTPTETITHAVDQIAIA